ncbi:hypothetical protein QZH41_012932, partial [Actinostola sp. cb2023]
LKRRGSKKLDKKSWYWLTGVQLDYDHWQRHQPSGDGKCANIARDYLNTIGGLNDLPCRGRYIPRGYICEMDTRIPEAENGKVFIEEWDGIEGLTVYNLTSQSSYPKSPSKSYHIDLFHIAKVFKVNFGVRMRSYLQAPITGNFTFYTNCDDACQLYMSTGVNPQNKRMLINQETDHKEFKSKPQFLEDGKLYYTEVLFKQSGGFAKMDIGIELPNGKAYATTPTNYLKRNVGEIDRPGKDCTKAGDTKFPDYLDCKDFTQLDKLNGVKTVLKELQSNILTNSDRPSDDDLEDSMTTAARKITFLLDETDIQSGQTQKDDAGFEVALEVEQLGTMVAEHLNQTQPINVEYPNIILQIKMLEDNFVFPDKSRNASSFHTNDQISIQRSQSDTGNYLVFSSLYKNLEDILRGNISTVDGGKEGAYFLNSRIITSSLIPAPKALDKQSVRIKLEHKRVSSLFNMIFKRSKGQMMTCVFWNFNSSTGNSTGAWSSDGCKLDEEASNENFTVCLSDHLTHFAVLMKVTVDEKPLSQAHLTALEAITYVGCSMSLIGELLTIVTLTCLRLTRTETNMIHLNLVVALGLAQIFFLSGINATAHKNVCTFVAVALHFFNLVAFCWMLVEGLWLYVMVVRVFDTGYNRIKRYVIAAWSIPAVIVIVTLVSSFDGYGTEHSCWLSVVKGTIWSFVVPVLVIVVVNAIILALVVREILKLHNPTPADDSKLKTAKSGVKSAIVLLPILGVAWVFGILAVNSQTVVFQYLFAIFNSLQVFILYYGHRLNGLWQMLEDWGFLIFIFHCVLNSEVRKAFRRKKQIWSDNQIFHCTTTPHPKYDSEVSKETKSTSNGVEKVSSSVRNSHNLISMNLWRLMYKDAAAMLAVQTIEANEECYVIGNQHGRHDVTCNHVGDTNKRS